MKASGADFSHANSFFLSPLLVVVVLGISIGTVSSYVFISIFFSIPLDSTGFTMLLVGIFFAANIIATFFTITIKIHWFFKRRVVELLNEDFNRDFLKSREKSFFNMLFAKLGHSINLAYKSLRTKKHSFSRTFSMLSIVCLLSGVLFTSAFVIRSTFRTHLGDAMSVAPGEDVFLIGHEDVVQYIQDSYSSFSSENSNHSIPPNFTTQSYIFNAGLFNESLINSSIQVMDSRLVYYSRVEEVQGYEFIDNKVETIGDHRILDLPIFGMDYSSTFNKWDDAFATLSNNSVLIGDSVALSIFENIDLQKLKVEGKEYQIEAGLLDTFNNGFSVYMSHEELTSRLGLNASQFNCMFLLMDGLDDGEKQNILSELAGYAQSLYGTNFTAANMGHSFDAAISSVDSLFWYVVIISIVILVLSIFYQVEVMKTSMNVLKRDFSIMRALGIKLKHLQQIVYYEFIMELLVSLLFSFSISLIFNGLFLLKDVILPSIVTPILIFFGIFITISLINWVIVKARVRYTLFSKKETS
ncbi:MAG: FtsX-like permease family protein [Promethearchaeota archaeon]